MKYNIFSVTLVEFRWNLEANMFCLTWTCLNVTQYVRSDPEQEEYHVTMQYDTIVYMSNEPSPRHPGCILRGVSGVVTIHRVPGAGGRGCGPHGGQVQPLQVSPRRQRLEVRRVRLAGEGRHHAAPQTRGWGFCRRGQNVNAFYMTRSGHFLVISDVRRL